jgi:hypothetical protein
MIFLENFAGTLPDWGSLAISIGTFVILVFVTFFQNSRIQELTEITSRLDKQNKIFQAWYDMESKNALYRQIPNFRIDGTMDVTDFGEACQYRFILTNMNATAHNFNELNGKQVFTIFFTFNIKEEAPPFNLTASHLLTIQQGNNPLIRQGDSVLIRMQLDVDSNTYIAGEQERRILTINFQDDFGRLINQEIFYDPSLKQERITNPVIISTT